MYTRRRYTRRYRKRSYRGRRQSRIARARRSKRFNGKVRYTQRKKNGTTSFHNKSVRRSYKGVIMRPLATRKQMFYLQNSVMYEQDASTFITGTGHILKDVVLGNFMSVSQLAYFKATYTYWRPWNVHLTVKVIGYRNLLKYTDITASTANYFETFNSTSKNLIDTYFTIFRSPELQTAAGAIDPDTSITAKENLLENNYYRRLEINGKPLSFHWYQPKAFQGAYSRTDAVAGSTVATGFQTMFNAVLENNDHPHGWDLMLFDRTAYPNATAVPNKMAIRFQIFGTLCLEATGNINTNL